MRHGVQISQNGLMEQPLHEKWAEPCKILLELVKYLPLQTHASADTETL